MIEVHYRNSPRTAIVFSGMAPVNHAYEWTKSFAALPVNLLGVKDPFNQWYQRDFDDTLDRLRIALKVMQTESLLCLGGSAGGFAALVFGKALNADRIVAFCPQSACGQMKRDLGDKRWPEMCLATPAADISGTYPTAEVHYAANDFLDTMHAKRIDAESHIWPDGGHDLPFLLKQTGALKEILEKSVRLPI